MKDNSNSLVGFCQGPVSFASGGQKVENLGSRGRDDSGNCPKVREMRNCGDALIVFSRWRQCIHLFLLSNGRLNSHRKTLFSCPPPNMERGGLAQYGLAGRHSSDLRFENPQFSTRGIVCCFIQRAWREALNHHHSSHNKSDISMRFPSINMNNWTWFQVLSACTEFYLCVKSTGTL